MARQSEIDKRIAEYEAAIKEAQQCIAVLRSVQKRNAPKPATTRKPRTAKPQTGRVAGVEGVTL